MFRQHPARQNPDQGLPHALLRPRRQLRALRSLPQKCGTGEPDAHGLAISPDGKYSVEFVECLAACGTAPVIMINDDFHEDVTHQRADELLSKYTEY